MSWSNVGGGGGRWAPAWPPRPRFQALAKKGTVKVNAIAVKRPPLRRGVGPIIPPAGGVHVQSVIVLMFGKRALGGSFYDIHRLRYLRNQRMNLSTGASGWAPPESAFRRGARIARSPLGWQPCARKSAYPGPVIPLPGVAAGFSRRAPSGRCRSAAFGDCPATPQERGIARCRKFSRVVRLN